MTLNTFFKLAFRKILRDAASVFYDFLKIDEKLFVFQSEGDFWDNARALYEYMIAHKFNEKYRLVWLVNEPSQYKRFAEKNVEFIKADSYNPPEIFKCQKIMRTARYFFFTHWGYKKARKNQIVVNLWHGGVVMKAFEGKPFLYKSFDYQSSPSQAAAERMQLFTGVRKEQVIVNGDCRQDYLFSDCENKVKCFLGKGYDKYILGMPTFKKTKTWTDASTESWILPVIKNKVQFEKLNSFCKKENVLLILKVHHLEDTSFIEAKNLTNIRIIKDDELQNSDIQLYELIGKTDALLTDFSSVAYDYMPLDKPIGYMISEMQNYSRGFITENIAEEMVGEKILNLDELEKFIADVKNGVDNYHHERKKILDKFYVYQKAGNCERLLNILKIKK